MKVKNSTKDKTKLENNLKQSKDEASSTKT